MSEEQKKEMTEEEVKAFRRKVAAEEFGGVPSSDTDNVNDAEVSQDEPPESISTSDGEDVISNNADTSEDKSEEDDRWAGVNPALRETLESLMSKVEPIDTLSMRVKQAESRLGAIQNEFYAAKKAADEIKKAPTAEEMAKASAEEEEWEELKEEYPGWAKAVEGRLSTILEAQKEKANEFSQGLTSLEKGIENKVGEIGEVFEKRLLSFKYPEWGKTIASKEYQEWLAKQPYALVQKTFSPLAEDAIMVLGAFSKRSKGTNDKRKQRLEQSVLASGAKTLSPKSDADMTDAEYRRKCAKDVWG